MLRRRLCSSALASGSLALCVSILFSIIFLIVWFYPVIPKDFSLSGSQVGSNSIFSLLSERKQDVPLIIVITPTYQRPTRFADLTRMSNTLRWVPHIHWIVIEDSKITVPYVRNILERSKIPFTYLAAETRKGYPRRGWYQRTTALRYLRDESELFLKDYNSGVVYFADDDNAYDIRLFTDYIRKVKRLGMWAVGLSGARPVEYPVVRNGTVVRFEAWLPQRKFATDMAGFAVNLNDILNSTAEFGKSCKKGAGSPETCFLVDLGFERSDIEPFGWEGKKGEKEVLVWHTKTSGPKIDRTKFQKVPYVFESELNIIFRCNTFKPQPC